MSPRPLITALLLLGTACLSLSCGPQQVTSETAAEAAQIIENKGSDTLVNLALAWAEEYMRLHPEVRIPLR